MKEGKFCNLEVSRIVVGKGHNPRKAFDKDLLTGLGDSMEDFSQLQPIIVNCKDGKNILVAGERRLRAAKKRNVKFIEAKVYEDLDELTALRMTMAENSKHVQLNVLEHARGYAMLMEHGIKEKEVAETEGLSPDTVRRRLSLLELAPDVQKLIVREKNPLPVHQALALKGIPKSDQIQIARRAAPITGPVASETLVKGWVKDAVGGTIQFPKETKPKDNTTPPSPGNSTPQANSPAADPVRPAKVKADKALKPVACTIGIAGKIFHASAGSNGAFIFIKKPTITVKVGDDVKVLSVERCEIDVNADDVPGIVKMIENGQPVAKKKVAKKKVAKKKTAKGK